MYICEHNYQHQDYGLTVSRTREGEREADRERGKITEEMIQSENYV